MTKIGAVLVTRPQPEADDFAGDLGRLGYTAIIEPMLTIHSAGFDLESAGDYGGLVFTSVNAVRAVAGSGFDRDVPVYCVGDQTARAAAERFDNVMSAQGTQAELIDLIGKNYKGSRPLLYLCGEQVTGDLAAALGKKAVAIVPLVVYRAEAAVQFSPACLSAIKEKTLAAVTFFSARTARVFFELVAWHGLQDDLDPIKLLSISEAVLKSVPSYGHGRTYTAQTPDRDGMTKLVKNTIRQE